MSSNTPVQSGNFVHFHHLSPDEQAIELVRLREFRNIERPIFEEVPVVSCLDAADWLIHSKALVPVIPDERLFGIARPIRDRYELPKSEADGSIPFLTQRALRVATEMMHEIKSAAIDHEFSGVLEEFGYVDFRMSLTSLTRTTHYQRTIAEQGKLAVGADGTDDHSTHETGQTFDLDHTGFYVRDRQGVEVPMNPLSGKPEVHARLRPYFKALLSSVVQIFVDQGQVLSLDEVPDGWGVFHNAVLLG